MTGLTEAERAELDDLREWVFSETEDEIVMRLWLAERGRKAAEQRTADLIAAVDAAEKITRCDQPHWMDICEHETKYALVPVAAINQLRTPPTIRTGNSTIHTDLAEQIADGHIQEEENE